MKPFAYSIFHPGQAQASGRLGLNLTSPKDLSSQLLVSALMVTRGNIDYITRSIQMFNLQSWPYKELLIVTDNASDDLRSIPQKEANLIRLIEVPPGLSLGDYRNISVARANGSFICQWDDDDFYHQDRILTMMTILQETNVEAAFLSRWLMWWEARETLAVSGPRIWEGSMVARKSAIRIYPSSPRAEDTAMVNSLAANSRIAMVDAPHLYCYSITGNNTWNEQHFEGLLQNASQIFTGEQYQKLLESTECLKILRAI